MPHKVVITGVLVESDSPELLIARDAAGTSYLVLLAERSQDGDRFLCVAVSSRRLEELCAGKIDLRRALEENENGEAFAGSYVPGSKEPTFNITPLEVVPSRWLPKEGFRLPLFLPQAQHARSTGETVDLELEALRKHASVGVLTFRPPESYPEPKITTYHLSEGLRLFQNVVRRSYEKAMTVAAKATRDFFYAEDGYEVQVLPQFVGGSFEVHFESKWTTVDLSGSTGVGLALKQLDDITRHIDQPELALPALRESGGEVVRSYQALLRFVAEEKTPLSYQWADPSMPIRARRQIGVDAAERTYRLIAARKELTTTTVTHTGTFLKLSNRAGVGEWRLDTGAKKVSGSTIEGAGDLLAGVVFRTQKYRVVCEERIDESVISRRPQKRLFLKEPPVLVAE